MALIQDPAVREIIQSAIAVHRELGQGLLESTYEGCLVHELVSRRISVRRQVPVAVVYKGLQIDCGYRLDLLVDTDVIVEVKSVDGLAPIHVAQILTYLKLTDARQALLMNFNETTLKKGLRSYMGRTAATRRT